MILIDTSAWVEFLRDTGSPACEAVKGSLQHDVVTCDPIRMEVLAGARDDTHLRDLRRLMNRAIQLPVKPEHYDDAALLYRRARRSGRTVRRLVDCLIAAIAIDYSIPLLQADRDFEALAACSDLRLA